MKRKYILSGLLACALTFSACDVDLLDIPQKGVENEENYYQTDEQCESAIAAVYVKFTVCASTTVNFPYLLSSLLAQKRTPPMSGGVP